MLSYESTNDIEGVEIAEDFEEETIILSLTFTLSNSSLFISADLLSSTVDPTTLWAVISGISSLWFLTFTAFIFSIKSEYIHTFFTTMTGKQQLHRIFHNAKDDKEKMSVFRKHRSYYKEIEEEVREFVAQNFYRFEEEKPEWWTAALKSRIPDDLLSAAALLEEEKKGGGKRRRSSFREVMGLESGGSAEVVVPASK